MWKKKLLVSLSVLLFLGVGLVYLSGQIYLRDNHIIVSPDQFSVEHSPAELKEDLEFLLLNFEKIHPDWRSQIQDDIFQQELDRIFDQLEKPLTRLEFYQLAGTLNGLIRDGHTYLVLPREEWDDYTRENLVFPITVDIKEERLLVAKNLSEDALIVPGQEIVKINGISSKQILRDVLAKESGESKVLKASFSEKLFYRALWALGLEAPYVVDVYDDVSATDVAVQLEGLRKDTFIEKRDGGESSVNEFKIIGENIGYLNFQDMDYSLSAFENFAEETFTIIHDNGVKDLILDLRENSGGDSRIGDELHKYLSPEKFPSLLKVEVKVTSEIKEYYRTLLPKGLQWFPLYKFVSILDQIENGTEGQSFDFYPDILGPIPFDSENSLRFDGNLYVLIGPMTYSSAAIFAAPLKHFERGLFIGQETGEPTIFYGETYPFQLPNTKLIAQVSHKKFVLVGATSDSEGILPDVSIPLDNEVDALETTLEIISNNQ